MMRLASLSPLQLATLVLGGSFAASTIFLLPVAHGSPLRGVSITTGLILFVTGVWLTFKVPTELESGIANQRWPETQVERLRSILNSSAVTVLLVVFLIAYASMAFQHNSFRHIAWCFFLPVQGINQLRMACKDPTRKTPLERISWNSTQPLQSEHWGER